MSFWSKFFIAFAITILATTGAVVGVLSGQKEQIDMGGSIKYTVPYFTVEFLNYDDTVFETQQVAYGHDAVAPATNPTRPGHTFNGWTDYTNITQNRRVTANWIKNEAYLTTGSKWQAIVNASAVGSQANIEQIEFVSSVPSGATLIGSVGVTNETATTVWTEGCGVFDVKAYYTALASGKYKISFYSPYTIYAPKDSSRLFSDSTSANQLKNLTSISFGNFNTSNVTNMGGMFSSCSSVTSLNVSNFNTSNVTNMNSMFDSCSKLTSLDLSNFNTSKVTGMSGMFTSCNSLTSLNLSNFNTSKVTTMSWMFLHCSKLTSLNVSSFDTSNVTAMFNMFYYCSSLTSLNLSNFNTSKVTDMSRMFWECHFLTSLNLSSFDMTKVTNTGYMLKGCSGLTEIKTPNAIGSAAVDLPTKTNYSWFDQANTNNVYTQITSACTSKTLVLHENYSYLRKDWQTALINNNTNFKQANIKTIQFVKSVPSGSGYTQVSVGATTSAGTTAYASGTAGVFDIIAYVKANSSDSTKYDVIFYSPVTIYAPVDSSRLFSNATTANVLTNLTSISFVNFNTSKVTYMVQMFYYCSSLTSLDVSSFDTSNVTNMSYMFCFCSSLTSLNVSNFDTSKVTSMFTMFSNCSKLTSLNVSNFDTSNVTDMVQMFRNCSSLTSLNLSSFNTSKVTDMGYMFDHCSKLTSLNLSSFDMSKVTSSFSMFYDCPKLTTIHTPKTMGSTTVDLPGVDDDLHAWYKSTDSNRYTPYTTISSSNTSSTITLRPIMRNVTITWGSDSNGNGDWNFNAQWNGSVQVSSSQSGTQSGTRTFRIEATTYIQCSFWIQSPGGLIWHKTGSVSISGTCTNSNFGSNTAGVSKGTASRTANASNFKSDITISFYFSASK